MLVLQTDDKCCRQSNFELLRIVAMFLVLLNHYVCEIKIENEVVQQSVIGSLATMYGLSLSIVCVNCFILISGYFGIVWKAKSFCSLMYQIFFWLGLDFLLAALSGFHYEMYGLFEIGKIFSIRWFIPAYLGLYLLSPLLNAFINSVDTRSLLKYILFFYLYSTVIGYCLVSDEFNKGFSVISLVGLYLIGAYLRRTDLAVFKFKKSIDLLIYLVLAGVLVAVYELSLEVGFNKSPFGYMNPVVIIMSIYLFLFFKKLDIGYVKVINVLAGSAFAVFLFHTHSYIYKVFRYICFEIAQQGYLTPLYVLLFFIGIYLSVFAVDQIRKQTFRLFFRK